MATKPTTPEKQALAKAQKDLFNHENKKPKPVWNVEPAPGAVKPQDPIEAINKLIKSSPVGSADRQKYMDQKAAYEKQLASWQAQYEKYSGVVNAAQKAADAADKLPALLRQQQNNRDTGVIDTKLDTKVKDLTKVTTAGAAAVASGSTTPELRYGPNGESLRPGTPEYAKGTTVKPVITATPTPTPVKSTGVTTPTPTAVVTPPTSQEAHDKAIAALQSLGNMGAYTIQMALIDSDPGLKDIFYNDVYLPISQGKPPVDPTKFQADLINSDWYKSYAGPARIAQAAKYGDPATWKLSVAEAEKLVISEAQTLGYTLDPTQVSSLAEFALNSSGGKAEGITGLVLTGLKKQLTTIGKINTAGGMAATGVSGLKATAASYLVGHLFNDDWYKNQEDLILKGETTQSAVESLIKSTAKSTYSSISDQIDAGLKPKDVLLPNVNRIANILEIDPSQVDVTNPKYAKLIFAQDPKDPSKQIFKSSWQSEIDAKKTDDWAYTKNSRESLDSVAHSVLTSLGMTY
jgi:hypothetical protein